MKRWIKPEAVAQQFVANDYVAACDTHVVFNCDFMQGQVGSGQTYRYLHYFGDIAGASVHLNYWPCGETHVFSKDSGELHEVTFSQYFSKTGTTEGSVCDGKHGAYVYDLPTPATGYGWVTLNSDGSFNDMHMSTSPTMESTKS